MIDHFGNEFVEHYVRVGEEIHLYVIIDNDATDKELLELARRYCEGDLKEKLDGTSLMLLDRYREFGPFLELYRKAIGL